MRAVGIVSLLTGIAGAAMPLLYWPAPWGYLAALILCTCVGVAHEGVLRGRG